MSERGGHGSDFDTVLERLLGDPSFAQALAADPASALTGYRLTADEMGLLSSQVSADPGGQHRVETRTNQSSVFGLLTPLAGLAGSGGLAGQIGSGGGLAGYLNSGGGEAVGSAVGDAVVAAGGVVGTGGGAGPIGASLGGALGGGTEGFGAAGAGASGEATAGASAGYSGGAGAVPEPAGPGSPREGIGAAPRDGYRTPPEGYRTRVDVNGDGDWDRHMLVGRRDGGVDILVDADRDGRADFVGHDTDADGRVDSADYDANRDGVFEKTMYDDDGDGWLDRTVRH